MKKAIVIYHRVDYDGIYSCCVALKWLKENNSYIDWDIYGYTYGDILPNYEEWCSKYDTIIMSDISFPDSVMLYLKENVRNLIWCDHHVTALERAKVSGFDDISGIREIGRGACELTWKYLFKTEAPYFIQLLSTYDVWDKERFDWENEVIPLQYSLKAKYSLSIDLASLHFEESLKLSPSNSDEVISLGKLIQDYQDQKNKSAVRNYSFPITIANKFKGICILGTDFGSGMFKEVMADYDVYSVANMRTMEDGTKTFQVSLYAEPGRIDFNLGEYVYKKYGDRAGGHACACGLKLDLEEFLKLIIDGEI